MRTGGYSVNLTKRVQTEEGLLYGPVDQSAMVELSLTLSS